MGFFRTWLAICVMIGHIVGKNPGDAFVNNHVLNASLAVEVFFAVSGFYMYYVIDQTYGKRPDFIRAFYSSRALRIFPTYWILLALTLLLIPNPLTEALTSGDAMTRYSYLLNNIFLLRSDAIGESWAIKVELIFYALAPFILLQRTWVIALLIALSLATKLWFLAHGQWIIHYFPGELCLFLTGALLCRYYLKYQLELRRRLAGKLGYIIAGFAAWTAFYSFGYVHFPDDSLNLRYGIYAATAIPFIPLLFEYARNSRLDRFVGELSYPIYLSHPLMIALATTRTTEYASLIVIPATLIFSLLLVKFLEIPVAAYRHRKYA